MIIIAMMKIILIWNSVNRKKHYKTEPYLTHRSKVCKCVWNEPH